MPPALHARLGHDASAGLLQLLEQSHREAREHVITACADRFERRLVEEVSALKVAMGAMEGRLHAEIASGRVEFIKWSFMFWIGQVLATIGIMTVVVRLLR